MFFVGAGPSVKFVKEKNEGLPFIDDDAFCRWEGGSAWWSFQEAVLDRK